MFTALKVCTKFSSVHVASGPPRMLRNSPIPTGFSFVWEEPEGVVPAFFSYLLTCLPALSGLETPEGVVTGPGGTSAAVTGLEDGASYSCSVVARVEGYVSQPVVVMVRTEETGKKSP
jgi:hypothetical protein